MATRPEPGVGSYYTGVSQRGTATSCGSRPTTRRYLVSLLVSGLLAAPVVASAQPALDVPVFPLRVRWSIDLVGAPSAGPATDGIHVYVGLADGRVVAVEATTGQVNWVATDAPSRYPPVVDGGRVHLIEADEVTTLDAATGAELWRVPLTAPASAPAVARGGWIVIPTEEAEVLALRAADGTAVWQRRYPNAVVARAAINGDRLYLPGADSQVRAVNLVTGQPLWERRIGGAVLSVSPLADRIYVGARDNFFYCLDEASGRILWRWRTGGDMVGPAQVDDRRVIFSNLDTLLRALDRRNGAQRWRRPLPWRPQTGPILMGSTRSGDRSRPRLAWVCHRHRAAGWRVHLVARPSRGARRRAAAHRACGASGRLPRDGARRWTRSGRRTCVWPAGQTADHPAGRAYGVDAASAACMTAASRDTPSAMRSSGADEYARRR
jgi:outer membrane protein assembly factor BamB